MGNKEFGNYLRLLRVKNKMTMTQTAGQTGITQGYISQIENGIYTPSAKTLAKLARAYSIPEIHLLRKAGIVKMSSTAMQSVMETPLGLDPLVDISTTGELTEQLKRGLAGLEFLADQIKQRGQLANMPAAEEGGATAASKQLSAEMSLPIHDATWQPLNNAAGEPAAFRLPAYMCADDADAFVLVVADEAMAPQIARGDWVVISPAAELKPGNVVAINDRNQMQLRRYMAADDIVSLLPLNPDYAAKSLLMYKSKDNVEIVGRVLRVVNRAL